MLNIRCGHCRRTLQIPERFLGQTGTCKYCGGRITVRVEPLHSSSQAEAEQEEEKAVDTLVDVSAGNKPSALGPLNQAGNKSLYAFLPPPTPMSPLPFRELIVNFLTGRIFGFFWAILCLAGGIFAISLIQDLFSRLTGVSGWFVKMGIVILIFCGLGVFKILIDKLVDRLS